MRKLKLLLMAFALLGGASSVWAYGWSDSDGATVGAGDFYLYNVGSQRFLTQGCWWGTHMASDGAGKVITISGSADAYNMHMAGIDAAKWLSSGDYVDTGVASGKTVTTDPDLQWTFTLVDATSHTYTIKNKSTNKYLGSIANTIYNTGHSVESAETAETTNYHWILIPKADRETLTGLTTTYPIDATHLVTNPDGEWYIRNESDTWKEYTHGGWSGNFSHNSTNESGYYASFYETWAGNSATGNGTKSGNNWHLNNFDEYNNITDLPNGKYRITMTAGAIQQGLDAEDVTGAYIYANTEQTAVTTRGNYNVECTITDGTIKAGMKTVNTTANWVSFDNLRLTYVDPCISVIAQEFTSGNTTIADTWYYYSIPTADDYEFTSSAATTLTYTTDGTELLSSATGTEEAFTATQKKTISLSAGLLYFKTSVATTLTVSYKYNVGSATTDKTEIQPGNTVTVTWADASTNDPGASLTKIFDGVKFNNSPVTCTSTDNGFTFEVPANLATGSDYTLYIPAGAIGYEDASLYNVAQNITLTTPVVYDGTYYLYDETNKLFVSCGANYGSRATVDEYGIPVVWDNSTKMLSLKNHTSVNFFFDAADHANCWIYTDGNSSRGDNRKFEFTSNGDGKYYLQDYAKTVYIAHDNSVFTVPTTIVGSAAVWTILTKAQHDAIVAAYPNANKTSVISDAGISTTAAEFETYLSNNYVEVDKTSEIGTATFSSNVGDWTWTQARGRDGQPAYSANGCEVFEATGTYSQTITGLDEGIYKVTVQGFERAGGYATCNTLGSEGYEIVTAYLGANDEKAQLKSWYSDRTDPSDPNSPAEAAVKFNGNKYINEVYVYVDDSGELEIKLVKPSYQGGNWLFFNNFTLTQYVPAEQVSVTAAGYATYVSTTNDLDYEGVEGLTAYKASVSGSTVVLTPVTKVKSGEGVVLKGDVTNDTKTYNVPITTGATSLDGNALVPGEGAAVLTEKDGYKNYVLSTDEDGNNVGFYLANGETVPTNRAYLQTVLTSARLTIVFEDEATGISTLKNADFKVEGYFDLQGRRVENPTKGLYIKDGKVVSVK